MIPTDPEHPQLGHRQNVQLGTQAEERAIQGKFHHNLALHVRPGTPAEVCAIRERVHRNLELLDTLRRLHRRCGIAPKAIDICTNIRTYSQSEHIKATLLRSMFIVQS